ncbi:cytosine permease [Streptomyces collinus]|uniref:Transmembrane protein n=1 Tax=Streptomyces collinus (strain DSM 40733 / Tue 365) TaxID=1214242 RepID=S5VN94_STRC3|nr:cytosine permease [Streptomyces collinus]AGS72057.1 transmembrane protein [Streptomyces collinus Tu 365]UJA10710.1 cytosine permease [Streptomyces collinus]UJA14426.1 cytosine permease [Streptomyces collinus]
MRKTAETDGALETRGIEQVPDHERTARTRGLFPTWVGANISVLLLTMGASLVVAYHLDIWQALVVAVAAPVVSYGLVGLIGIAGKRGGAPGMALSRAVFGQRGNLLPGALIWVARWGWETINAVTGAYAMLTILDIVLGVRADGVLDMVMLLVFVVATFAISGLGINAVQKCNKYATYFFGVFSVLVLVYLAVHTDWSKVTHQGAGSTAAVITGVGMIAAGGVSWIPSAPDFTRYLPRTASSKAIVGTAVGGAGIVVLPMVLMGAVMAVSTPDLASASDPVSFVGEILPTWLAVPYLLIALIGMLLINSMSMYSAGFTAQTLGFRVPRHWAVSVNAVISLVFGGVLMLVATSFLGSFIAFLSLLAVAFSAWVGVFGADMLRRTEYDGRAMTDTTRTSAYWYRGGFSPAAVAAWAIGLAAGLMFTTSDWFTGPLAKNNVIGEYGLGWVATIVISGLLYLVLPKPAVVTAAPDSESAGTTGSAASAAETAEESATAGV